MTLRLAIVGGGHGLAVHLPAAHEARGVSPVLLYCGSHPSPPSVRTTASWLEATTDPGIDAVLIALPPPLQLQAVKAAAAAGKAVLCEKPAGMSEVETLAMVEACDASGVAHAVGYQFRFEPALVRLRQSIQAGDLGTVDRIEVDWMVGTPQARLRPWSWRNSRAMGGGVGLNFASHVVDYLSWLGATPLQRLHACERTLVASREDPAGVVRAVDAPDSYDALFRFEDGVPVSIRVCNQVLHGTGHAITVWGSKAVVRLAWKPPFGPTNTTLTLTTADGEANLMQLPLNAHTSIDTRIAPTASLLEAFTLHVAGSASGALATLHDAARVHRLLASSAEH